MLINPCKSCENRTIGCHGSCELYIEWRKKFEENKAFIYKQKQPNSQMYSLKLEQVRRAIKRKNGK